MAIKKFIKQKKKLIITVLSIIILLLSGMIISNSKPNNEANAISKPHDSIKVFIDGYVQYPDEYNVSPYTKIKDLITIAGGALPNGDTSLLNLEKVLDAGEIVYVNNKLSQSNKVNINLANVQVLKKELKLTNKQANNLVLYRTLNGSFKNVYELLKVDGFNAFTINEIINAITL